MPLGAAPSETGLPGTLRSMRNLTQDEAHAMRDALKTIASYYNPAAEQDGGQTAAKLARETLAQLGLLYESEAKT
jgi:hypothetical protein